jgi:hypothetical protein
MVRALVALLLVVLCSLQTGCATLAALGGIGEVAGKVPVFAAKLEELDDALARSILETQAVRSEVQEQEQANEEQDDAIETQGKAVAEVKDKQEDQPSPLVTSGSAILAAFLADYLQGQRRDRKHDDRDRNLEARVARKRRKKDEDDGEDDAAPG